ncbi:MAG: hypothetical protein ACJ8EY_07280 [Sphingomicrobium sp.]
MTARRGNGEEAGAGDAGLLARGWSYDESWDREIPPGWIKGPDWRPMQPGDE